MDKRYGWAASCAMLLAAPMTSSAADSMDNLRYAFSGGAPSVDLRARWEHAEQDNALTPANAYTVRARLGYTTGKWNDLDLLTEFEGTFPLGAEAYNSGPGGNGKTTRVVIADPKGTELNQFVLRYTGLAGNVFKLGRQKVILDNQRFVGNSGWRQNEVTYDAVSVVNTQLAKTTLSYTYLGRVNDKNYTGYQLNGHLLNLAYALAPQINLVGYGYVLDFDNTSQGATSCSFADTNAQQKVITRCDSQTYGLRASGAFPFSGFKLLYTAEYAHQNHYKDAPGAVGASYYLAEFGGVSHGVTAKLGYENMGGDGSYSFQTPLATLHAFDGWADLFLNTPVKGIRDAYARVEGEAPLGLKLLGFYHDFRNDQGHDKLGTELDLQAVKAINDNFSVMLKYAHFNSSTNAAPFVDTRKGWLQAEYKF
jgi:hypothetical protein